MEGGQKDQRDQNLLCLRWNHHDDDVYDDGVDGDASFEDCHC